MEYAIQEYLSSSRRGGKCRVVAIRITDPSQILSDSEKSIHAVLLREGMAKAIGLYFYRFEDLGLAAAFSKIGEVSRKEGIQERKKRGWLGTNTYGDTYLDKKIHEDILTASPSKALYFVFYEFSTPDSLPKIDELLAFEKHKNHFGKNPRNRESSNSNSSLGRNLVWHQSAFDEVLNLEFPDGTSYADAFLAKEHQVKSEMEAPSVSSEGLSANASL